MGIGTLRRHYEQADNPKPAVKQEAAVKPEAEQEVKTEQTKKKGKS